MGRLLKKKDPEKKRAQRLERTGDEGTANGAQGGAPAKIAPAARKAQPPAKSRPVAGAEDNFIRKSIQFLREVKSELKKVTWPSRKQTMGSTAVVIILVMAISLFLGTVDFALSSLVRIVLP